MTKMQLLPENKREFLNWCKDVQPSVRGAGTSEHPKIVIPRIDQDADVVEVGDLVENINGVLTIIKP